MVVQRFSRYARDTLLTRWSGEVLTFIENEEAFLWTERQGSGTEGPGAVVKDENDKR